MSELGLLNSVTFALDYCSKIKLSKFWLATWDRSSNSSSLKERRFVSMHYHYRLSRNVRKPYIYRVGRKNENDNIAIKLLSLYASMIAALNGLNEKEKRKKRENSFGSGNQDDRKTKTQQQQQQQQQPQ